MLLRVVSAVGSAPQGALLSPQVALFAFEGAAPEGGAVQIGARGRPLAPPYGTVEVGTEHAPARIAAFRLPSAMPGEDSIPIECGGEHARLYPAEFEADPFTLAARLDKAARRRLLDFLLSFCSPAFKLGRSPEFARLCARLALDCAEAGGTAPVLAEVLADQALIGGVRARAGSALVVIGRGRVAHGRLPLHGGEELQIVPRPEPGDLLVATGPDPVVWHLDVPASLPHVLSLPETGGAISGAAARAACREGLRGHRSAAARSLLREIALLYPAQPRRVTDPAQPVAGEVELAVPDGAGGLFVAGWLRDPAGLVGALALAAAGAQVPIPSSALARVRRPDVEKRFAGAAHAGAGADGFVLYLPDLPGEGVAGVQPQLVLRLGSGAEIRLTPPARSLPPAAARDAVLAAVPPGQLTPAVMERCVAPAAARLHRAAMARRGAPEVIRIGQSPARPPVALIVPLYRNLGFLRFQIAAFAEDPRCRRAEIVFVLDSPEQRGEAEHLLRGLHRLTGLAMALVVMPRNLGYAAATNAGAAVATAPLLLLLNSDVVPAGPGWLAAMLAPFARPAVAATGPKLLFEDTSIQHAGLYFERDEDGVWFNRHYHKGMPRAWPGATRRRRVPGVTGAALLIRRTVFERIGGVCEDYIIGDYEDSDLCLRVGEAGGAILYVPQAELFHFERRSIRLHQGYAGTHAALYNRLLHHARWDSAMAAAMAEAARRGGPA
jgi:GT2 family glycosyltransferase